MKANILFLTVTAVILAAFLLKPRHNDTNSMRMAEALDVAGEETAEGQGNTFSETLTQADEKGMRVPERRKSGGNDTEAAKANASDYSAALHEAVKRKDIETARAIVQKIIEERKAANND